MIILFIIIICYVYTVIRMYGLFRIIMDYYGQLWIITDYYDYDYIRTLHTVN